MYLSSVLRNVLSKIIKEIIIEILIKAFIIKELKILKKIVVFVFSVIFLELR